MLLLHEIQQNLMKNEMDYYVHLVMHVRQLKLVLLKGIMKYILKVLKKKEIVQLMHVFAVQISLNCERKEKERKWKQRKEKPGKTTMFQQ